MLSFSNFGSNTHPAARKVRRAVEIVTEKAPDLEIDGEMQADTAVFEGILHESYPWSRLEGPANILIFPELQSANIAYKLIWRLANAEAIGPILLGMEKPVHVLQNGLEVSDIVNMAALCVVDAQEAGAKVIKPGAMYSDVHRAATEVIKSGLLKLGLITDRNSNQYRIWFMHGTSHWLGMNVHDVGSAARLEPGMVFTNEPGIYIRPDALDLQPFGFKPEEWEKFKNEIRPAFEKYKGIGVRIEDDMLVTETGTRWMTEALPRKLTDIEAFMARAKRREY